MASDVGALPSPRLWKAPAVPVFPRGRFPVLTRLERKPASATMHQQLVSLSVGAVSAGCAFFILARARCRLFMGEGLARRVCSAMLFRLRDLFIDDRLPLQEGPAVSIRGQHEQPADNVAGKDPTR